MKPKAFTCQSVSGIDANLLLLFYFFVCHPSIHKWTLSVAASSSCNWSHKYWNNTWTLPESIPNRWLVIRIEEHQQEGHSRENWLCYLSIEWTDRVRLKKTTSHQNRTPWSGLSECFIQSNCTLPKTNNFLFSCTKWGASMKQFGRKAIHQGEQDYYFNTNKKGTRQSS